MEETNLIPYLFQLMVDQAGGIVDFDAHQVLKLIESEHPKIASLSFIEGGILRLELIDEEEKHEN